jgi:hypothetical protein
LPSVSTRRTRPANISNQEVSGAVSKGGERGKGEGEGFMEIVAQSQENAKISKIQEYFDLLRYPEALFLIIFKFKWFYFIIFICVLSFTGWSIVQWKDTPKEFWPYLSAGITGFTVNAFFCCPARFFLRGVKDGVYFIDNSFPFRPRIFQLQGRETFNALIADWTKVLNVPEVLVRFLHKKSGSRKLNIKTDASICKLSDPKQNSYFAIFCCYRYGIPDTETREAVWGEKHEEWSVDKLDKWLPGEGLVSVHYWPEKDR